MPRQTICAEVQSVKGKCRCKRRESIDYARLWEEAHKGKFPSFKEMCQQKGIPIQIGTSKPISFGEYLTFKGDLNMGRKKKFGDVLPYNYPPIEEYGSAGFAYVPNVKEIQNTLIIAGAAGAGLVGGLYLRDELEKRVEFLRSKPYITGLGLIAVGLFAGKLISNKSPDIGAAVTAVLASVGAGTLIGKYVLKKDLNLQAQPASTAAVTTPAITGLDRIAIEEQMLGQGVVVSERELDSVVVEERPFETVLAGGIKVGDQSYVPEYSPGSGY